MKGTPLWKALFLEHRIPTRYKFSTYWKKLPWVKREARFIDYILLKYINRILLRLRPLPKSIRKDITVIIAVKNRYDHRIINAFKSIREQNYPQNLIKITLVDYDSKKELISKYKKACKKYNAGYIRINNKPIWCKSHALNIAIKKAKTKYVLSSDIDIIFEKNYIKTAIKELQKNPYQLILSNSLDSPEGDIENEINLKKEYSKFKKNSKLERDFFGAWNRKLGTGINLTLTHFYNLIHGYDEKYKLYGAEDNDIFKRFLYFGLKIKDISNKTSYIHQWHPQYQGIRIKGYQKKIEENKEYCKKHNSIVRNKNRWGEI